MNRGRRPEQDLQKAVLEQTRLTVLHELNTAITKVREKRGLEPISDPLQGAPFNAFQRIRTIMFPASAGEPTSGNG